MTAKNKIKAKEITKQEMEEAILDSLFGKKEEDDSESAKED